MVNSYRYNVEFNSDPPTITSVAPKAGTTTTLSILATIPADLTNIDHYELWKSEAGGVYAFEGDSFNNNAANFGDITPDNVICCYKMRSTDGIGGYSDFSNIMCGCHNEFGDPCSI